MPYGVKFNVRAPHKFLRMGGLCWLANECTGWGNSRFQVSGMSRGGRIVHTWIDARDLENYRAGWFEGGGVTQRYQFETRERAQAWADTIGDAYSRDPVRLHAQAFGQTVAGGR